MTTEEIQQAWETKSHCNAPLKVSFYETDGQGYAKLFCEGCFNSFVKQTETYLIDEVL